MITQCIKDTTSNIIKNLVIYMSTLFVKGNFGVKIIWILF